MNTYYVYAYLRKSDSLTSKAGTPYYIGYGHGDRAFVKHSHRNNKDFTPKDKRFIVILESTLTSIGALAIERRLIRWYGRKDLGTGILINRTDGGDGGPNSKPIRKPHSDETKEKISVANLGKKRTLETRLRIGESKKGQRVSEENKKLLSNLYKGVPKSTETRAKMSLAKQNMSDDTKEKMSKAAKGKPKSESHKEKIRQVSLSMSPDTKSKMSAAKKGKTYEEIYGLEKAKLMRELRSQKQKVRYNGG